MMVSAMIPGSQNFSCGWGYKTAENLAEDIAVDCLVSPARVTALIPSMRLADLRVNIPSVPARRVPARRVRLVPARRVRLSPVRPRGFRVPEQPGDEQPGDRQDVPHRDCVYDR
jgi:hypothetical protein